MHKERVLAHLPVKQQFLAMLQTTPTIRQKTMSRYALLYCKMMYTSNDYIPLQSCTLSQDLGTCLSFPALRSPRLCYFTPPRLDFCLPLEIPFPSGSG